MTTTFNRQVSALFAGSGGALIDLTETGRQLNIAFVVERNLDLESSTAEITIFNLSEETRQKLAEKRRWTVELAAGYGTGPHPFFLSGSSMGSGDFEQNTNVIFKGDVRFVRHRREPPLLTTSIEADDGGEASKKYVTRHFPKGTTTGTVFKWLQEQSGLGAGNVTRISQVNSDKGLPDRLKNGMTVRGYVMEEISDLARSRSTKQGEDAPGLGWRVSSQNGEMIVLRPGEPLPGVPVTKISASTGMVGYPYVDNEGILTLNHRLLPNVFPGAPIDVKSEFVNGRFVVERTVHSGSLWDEDFSVEIEARAQA